ncbi:RSP_7527 family protein [Roseobacter sp.]|uniref:RSP_7527 family protein n=1 Tax=Roseobacter sp. TaxID=1907202 RepID=UPI0025EA2403|nr:hypothetical protein [Roseobacter sp.]
MKPQIAFTSPTQAEIDRAIARAHQMRSDYIAQSINTLIAKLSGAAARRHNPTGVRA